MVAYKKSKLAYFSGKLLIFLISIVVLSMAVFAISRLTPTDPLQSYYGERTEKMSVEEKEWAREKLGLNDSIPVQYVRWVKGALQGDFGISYKYKQDVLVVISKRIGNTLILGGIGFVLIFAGSLLLGILCTWYEDSWLDKILCKVGTIISCIPEFWLSLVLILVFCVMLKWLPSSGAYSVGKENDLKDRVIHLILPMVIVVIEHLWYYAYMIRNLILEEVRADYVLLCKGKGLSRRQILFGHCLRNVMPMYISLMAISIPHIIGGTYIVETVFSYPGIGTLSYESARYADYNMLMVLCMLTGVAVIFFNMIGQIINEQIDPRVKASEVMETSEIMEQEKA
ncbi:MAG: ABC transporter permease [Lachnospiraceae bacterium]|nr:ABC transporter permease [Lachnospiraceae bacterium]